ncbi:hypothetical protein N9Y42_10935, partial [Mariniblastus sp.]|nr:hypothetical protein [Mariniblastus sp.]
GVALYFEGDNTTPGISGFIPVDDIETLLDVISDVADVEESGDGKYTIVAPDGTEFQVVEKGGYALFASRADLLELLPTEPEQMLGKKSAKYNLAFNISPQNIPKELRDQALDTIKEGLTQTLDQLDEELEEMQQKNLDSQMRQFEMLFNDSETIMIGMSADADKQKLYTDLEFTAKAGSELAKKTNETKATTPSKFSGFLMPNAAMNFNANGKMPEADAETYANLMAEGKKSMIDQLNEAGELSEAEFEKMEALIESVVDVMTETLKEGVVDSGACVVLEDSDANMIGGLTVADPAKIETAVKDLVPMLKERLADIDDPDAPEFTFNLDKETQDGVRFHQILISIDDPIASEMFGDSIEAIIGFGEDSIYFGVGNDPLPMIKKAKASKQETEFSSEMNIRLAPIMKYASRFPDTPPQVIILAEELSENGGDRIRAYSKHIPNGSFTRFEMEDGILSLIKSAYEAFQQQGFRNDF